jgi:hypothetical protein
MTRPTGFYQKRGEVGEGTDRTRNLLMVMEVKSVFVTIILNWIKPAIRRFRLARIITALTTKKSSLSSHPTFFNASLFDIK